MQITDNWNEEFRNDNKTIEIDINDKINLPYSLNSIYSKFIVSKPFENVRESEDRQQLIIYGVMIMRDNPQESGYIVLSEIEHHKIKGRIIYPQIHKNEFELKAIIKDADKWCRAYFNSSNNSSNKSGWIIQ